MVLLMNILNSFRKNDTVLSDKTFNIPAGFFRRFAAGAIDLTIITALVYAQKMITFFKASGFENTYVIYYFALLSFYHTTVGGKILKIYTVKNNGENLSRLRCMLKSFVILSFLLAGIVTLFANGFFTKEGLSVSILTIALIIGFTLLISLPMVFTKSKKSLVDILSGTKVICINQNKKNLP
jgi:uncharacterized RDD family membrane protein YckC